METRQNESASLFLNLLPSELIQHILHFSIIPGVNPTNLRLVNHLFKDLVEDLKARKALRIISPTNALRELDAEQLDEVPYKKAKTSAVNANPFYPAGSGLAVLGTPTGALSFVPPFNGMVGSNFEDSENEKYKKFHEAALAYCKAVFQSEVHKLPTQFILTNDFLGDEDQAKEFRQYKAFMFSRIDSLLSPEISGIKITSIQFSMLNGEPRVILNNFSNMFAYALIKNHWSVIKYILDLIVFNSENNPQGPFPRISQYLFHLLMSKIKHYPLIKHELKEIKKSLNWKQKDKNKFDNLDCIGYTIIKNNKLLGYYLIHFFLLSGMVTYGTAGQPSKWLSISNSLFLAIDLKQFDFAKVFARAASNVMFSDTLRQTVAQVYLSVALKYLANPKHINPRYKAIVDYLINQGVMPHTYYGLNVSTLSYLAEFESQNEAFRTIHEAMKKNVKNFLQRYQEEAQKKKNNSNKTEFIAPSDNKSGSMPTSLDTTLQSSSPMHSPNPAGYPFFLNNIQTSITPGIMENSPATKKEVDDGALHHQQDDHQPSAKKPKTENPRIFYPSTMGFGCGGIPSSFWFQNQAQEPLPPVPPLVDDEEARQILQRQRNQAAHTDTETENTQAFSTPKKEG